MLKNCGLIQRNTSFKDNYFKKNSVKLLDLAKNGQHPKALFIGCADSRVIPNLITQTDPGDLFVIRNVGNFVAPYNPSDELHSTAAGIEYAISALKVSEIIICGHTHCGAIGALYSDIDEKSFLHTKKWLSLGAKAKSIATMSVDKNIAKDKLLRITEKISVITQIEHLMTYPAVVEGVKNGSLNIHGWIYDIESGNIEYYDEEKSEFVSLISENQNVINTSESSSVLRRA